jgi:hypothetical protein
MLVVFTFHQVCSSYLLSMPYICLESPISLQTWGKIKQNVLIKPNKENIHHFNSHFVIFQGP